MTITISPETKQQSIASIKRYFEELMDQEIGDLKANLLLDYVLKEIGPIVYNQAIADAQVYFHEKTAELDGSCFEREFSYWSKDREKLKHTHPSAIGTLPRSSALALSTNEWMHSAEHKRHEYERCEAR